MTAPDERAVEEMAREVLAADGYRETDQQWSMTLTHHREMCAKYPDYQQGRSLILDAFRRARALFAAGYAKRADVLEEAATIAFSHQTGERSEYGSGGDSTARDIADELRALASRDGGK